jgi:PAS domain
MSAQEPVSYHLDLYSYWLSKRGSRRMPARSDLDPADIIPLLPHLIIAEKDGDQFRYRLIGTGVVRDVGFDATGYFVGEYLNNPNVYAEVRALYEMVCVTGDPVFATGEFCFNSFRLGALHAWSCLILPLSDGQSTVNKAVSSFITRFHPGTASSRDWLKEQPSKVFGVADIRGAGELEALCRDWEYRGELAEEHP